MPRHSMPPSPQSLLLRQVFRNPTTLSPVVKSGSRKTHWRRSSQFGLRQVHRTTKEAPASAEGAGWWHCEAILNYLWKIMVTGGDSLWWGKNCYSYLQEGQRRGSQTYKLASLTLKTGTNLPSAISRYEGQVDDWRESVWIYEGAIIPDYTNSLLQWFHFMDEKRAADGYLNFRKAFGIDSYNIPIGSLLEHTN